MKAGENNFAFAVIREVFHDYLNKFENAITHLFLVTLDYTCT